MNLSAYIYQRSNETELVFLDEPVLDACLTR
ncbi:hypothetical protein C7M51_03132 [Mixta intestinalis]|uniref:Uncharacterized protein n=1 Tax=Mixta intestinalis TaxID=1615494 RepID=A0A6P1Q1F5_9GAMM|nr:hypothetical protein C7M51_03132 [Mixta intestinalis]